MFIDNVNAPGTIMWFPPRFETDRRPSDGLSERTYSYSGGRAAAAAAEEISIAAVGK